MVRDGRSQTIGGRAKYLVAGFAAKIIDLYVPKIDEAIKKDALSDAQALFKSYERYGPDQQQALDFQAKSPLWPPKFKRPNKSA